MATTAMQCHLLVLCALLAATGVATDPPFVPSAWKDAVCKEAAGPPEPGAIPEGAAVATASAANEYVKVTADRTAGVKYLVMLTPGVGCMLFYVGWNGTTPTSLPVLVGTSQTAGISLGSGYSCIFDKNSAVPVPGLAPAAFPTSFAAVRSQVRCSFLLYNKNPASAPGKFNWYYTDIGGSSVITLFGGNKELLKVGCKATASYANNLILSVTNDGTCFPRWATVQTPSGPKQMAEVQVGDKVLAMGANGKPFFDDVYLTPHKDSVAVAEYLTLTTADAVAPRHQSKAAALTLSAQHYLEVLCGAAGEKGAGSAASATGTRCYRQAQHVVPRDKVWLQADNNEDSNMRLATIIQVTKSVESGLYSPWTLSGSIIVDGVAAAMHTAWPGEQTLLQLLPPYLRLVAAHKLAQAHQLLLTPLRVMYRITGPTPFKALDHIVDYFMSQGAFTQQSALAKDAAAPASAELMRVFGGMLPFSGPGY